MKNMKSRIWTVLASALLLCGLMLQQTPDANAFVASLRTSIQFVANAQLTNVVGLATASAPVMLQQNTTFLDGTGANQNRVVWSDSRTINASTTEDLDMVGGGLVDPFGVAFAPTKIRGIMIIASSGNTNNVVVGGDANSVPFLSTAATTISIKPGGLFVITDPSTAGITVTAGTGDIIQVANSGAGTSVTYQILVIGI
jgi:hypothetical protein